jgi:hypothetical protein
MIAFTASSHFRGKPPCPDWQVGEGAPAFVLMTDQEYGKCETKFKAIGRFSIKENNRNIFSTDRNEDKISRPLRRLAFNQQPVDQPACGALHLAAIS